MRLEREWASRGEREDGPLNLLHFKVGFKKLCITWIPLKASATIISSKF